MALTSSEEAMVRQLLDQQSAILALANNEATITSKLSATKVTLSDLAAATSLAEPDLLLVRQGVSDKSVAVSVLTAAIAALGATGQQKKQQFTAGVDYTAGVSTTVTLTEAPIAPSKDSLTVYFGAAYQQEGEWAYNAGTGVITFTDPIPGGVTKVETQWITPLAIGTPGDGTVVTSKLADLAVTTAKLSSALISAAVDDVAPDAAADYALVHDASAGGLKKVLLGRLKRAILKSEVPTTSGLHVELATDIPAWANRVTVLIDAVSTSGTAVALLQAGTAGGYLTTGYTGMFGIHGNVNNTSVTPNSSYGASGLNVSGNRADDLRWGRAVFERMNGNKWRATAWIVTSASLYSLISHATFTLAGDLDRIRLSTTATDTYDGGSAVVIVE